MFKKLKRHSAKFWVSVLKNEFEDLYRKMLNYEYLEEERHDLAKIIKSLDKKIKNFHNYYKE